MCLRLYLCVFACACVCLQMCLCVFAYVSLCVCICACVCLQMCLFVFAYVSLCVFICACVFFQMCLCVFAYISLCVCICVYVCLQTFSRRSCWAGSSCWLALGVFIRNSWHSLLIGSQHEYSGLYLWPSSSSIQSAWITWILPLPASKSDFQLNLQERAWWLLVLVHIV